MDVSRRLVGFYFTQIKEVVTIGQGLRPHFHQYFELETKYYYDKYSGIEYKTIIYECMICGKSKHETYCEYKGLPKSKTTKLDRIKKKYGNR